MSPDGRAWAHPEADFDRGARLPVLEAEEARRRASSVVGRLVARAGELLAIRVPRYAAIRAVPAELHVDRAGNE